jgi:uncharacterized protein YycO
VIKLQFVCENAISSALIALFSAGHFSHVDAVWGKTSLLGARSDGLPPGVEVRPAEYLRFSTRVVFEIPATAHQKAKWRAFLKAQIGKPYDHSAIWGFVRGRDWRQADSWICSELQAAALEHAGVLPKLYIATNKITPVFLAGLVSAIGATATEY